MEPVLVKNFYTKQSTWIYPVSCLPSMDCIIYLAPMIPEDFPLLDRFCQVTGSSNWSAAAVHVHQRSTWDSSRLVDKPWMTSQAIMSSLQEGSKILMVSTWIQIHQAPLQPGVHMIFSLVIPCNSYIIIHTHLQLGLSQVLGSKISPNTLLCTSHNRKIAQLKYPPKVQKTP